MNQHTPGPWLLMTRPEYDGERLGDGSVVGGPTGRDEYDPDLGVCALEDLRAAAEQDVEPYSTCKPELAADAYLIAAAPDLLACLAACHSILVQFTDYQGGEWCPKVEAALAKARGEAPKGGAP